MATQHSLTSLNLGQVSLFFCFLIGLTAAAPQPKEHSVPWRQHHRRLRPGTVASLPALIQEKIDAKKWMFRTVNAGQSGDTSASGLNRLDWLLRSRVDILVLELGGNDGLRGLPPDTTRRISKRSSSSREKNTRKSKSYWPGMKVPPNMGADYAKKFARSTRTWRKSTTPCSSPLSWNTSAAFAN